DNVGVDRLLARENTSEIGSHFIDALAEYVAVGPREIDVLEDAVRQRRRCEWLDRSYSAGADDEDFARLDVANVSGANQIHRAGFGTDDRRIAEPPERERTEAMRVADGDQTIACQDDERKRALHLRHRLD